MKLALAGVAAVLAGVVPATAGGSGAATLSVKFSGYANDTRVVAPLVGAFQLGISRLRGSATLGSSFSGSFTVTFAPRSERYGRATLKGRIVGYSYTQAPHAVWTKVTMRFEVESAGPRCTPGTQATLTLFNSSALLSNGQTSDYITISGWPNLPNCATFVMGWTNADGGARTTPARGGPGGGEWANVDVSLQ